MTKETVSSWSEAHSREKQRQRRIFYALCLIAIYTFFVLAAWLTIYSPLFRIKETEITGNKSVSNDDIMTLVKSEVFGDSFWKLVLGMRNILIWPDGFRDNLKFLPELKSLSVEKNYVQRRIKIIAEERKPFGVWCVKKNDAEQVESSDCFWFDEKGIIFKRAIDMEGNLVVVLDDYSQKNMGLNLKILPDEFIANIFSIFRAVSNSKLRVKETRLNDLSLREIEVDTYDGPKIYFSMRFPADNTPEVIKSLREKTSFGNLEYVDFRVENRAYYK
ncbi:MAG: FtsQ-type POTRA domain-containing protein [Patescibacteria group bacterium]